MKVPLSTVPEQVEPSPAEEQDGLPPVTEQELLPEGKQGEPSAETEEELANYFSNFSKPPRISNLVGKEVYDGKGQPAVQVEVLCTIQSNEKSICSAAISSHSEPPGSDYALPEAWEMDDTKRKESVSIALQWINKPLAALLKGHEPADQLKADTLLSDFFQVHVAEKQEQMEQEKKQQELMVAVESEPLPPPQPSPVANKKEKRASGKGKKTCVPEKPIPPAEPQELVLPGSMAVGSVSMAVCKAAAILSSIPLFQHIFAINHQQPILKTVSDLGALVIGFERLEQPLDLIRDASKTLELTVGEDLHLAINCAAHELIDYQKGKYEVMTGTPKNPNEMVDLYVDLISRYPAVIALIDPLRKEDKEQWNKLYTAVSSKCYLLAEMASKPISSLLVEKDLTVPGFSGVILKQTNQTTVSDMIEINRRMRVELLKGNLKSVKQKMRCRTIAMETGAQNVQICSTVLQLSFPPQQLVLMFTFPMIYGSFQLLDGLVIVAAFFSGALRSTSSSAWFISSYYLVSVITYLIATVPETDRSGVAQLGIFTVQYC
ncbi:UNVERIFIED_CONTAM: hypothetical protein FKN15_022480 [Acipenser sinensis]